MRFLRFLSLAGFASFFALQVPAWAGGTSTALGHSGQLQRAIVGPYGDLFADESETITSETPVLQLVIAAPGEEAARLLVPGTEDVRIEANPLLFQDPKHDAVILLWQSLGGEADHQLRFASFDGAEWSDVYSVSDENGAAAIGDSPFVVESRDDFELTLDEGESLTAERRILHLLWHTGDEPPATRYAPLTFVEGRYLGWHKIFALDEMFFDTPASEEGSETDGDADGDGTSTQQGEPPQIQLTASLARTSNLRVARDGRSILVTFANPHSHRLGTLEVSPLPLELGFLGDQVREQIFSMIDLYDPDNLSSFSDGVRAAVIVMGSTFNFHEAYGRYVADRVGDWILSSGQDYGWANFEKFGNDARNLAIDVSNEVYLSIKADPANPDAEIIEINIAGLLEGEQDPTQTLDIMLRSDQPAPAVGEGPTTVFASQNGRSLLVAWEDEEAGQIRWVESRRGAPWSEPFSLMLDDSLSLEDAHSLLQQKIR